MRKLIFAKKINGTNETGLVDITKNPPEIFCLCDENKAKEILNLVSGCESLKKEIEQLKSKEIKWNFELNDSDESDIIEEK